MIHEILRPFIVKVSELGYFPLHPLLGKYNKTANLTINGINSFY